VPRSCHIYSEISPAYIAQAEDVYCEGKPNIDFIKAHFLNQGLVSIEVAKQIIRTASELFRKESNVLRLPSPITICGDIHGQYHDLINLFSNEIGGDPFSTSYLFLGDYVDRGYFSMEVLLYLYTIKILNPNGMFLLRGNHECRVMTTYFTFKTEALKKYDEEVYNLAVESFQCLPLAAIVDDTFFCLHGGLSPSLETIQDIEKVDRFREPGKEGLLFDLLWADPHDDFGNEQEGTLFGPNKLRNASFTFSAEAAKIFLQRNKLKTIIRAHQALEEGFKIHKQGTSAPLVITLFSAPNYLGQSMNRAAVIRYEKINGIRPNVTVEKFNATEMPIVLPGFKNIFEFSLPVVMSAFTKIVSDFLKCVRPEELFDDIKDKTEREIRKQRYLQKIKAVGRMARIFNTIKQESDSITQLKLLLSVNRLPVGSLAEGGDGIRRGNYRFT
jgi:serine/threonine-protein phosphatase 2B catalytic subunit